MSKDFEEYVKLAFEDQSGIAIGTEGDQPTVWQITMGSEITGIWTEENEKEYREFAEKMNWQIIREVIRLPGFWDIGVIPEEDLLDLDF